MTASSITELARALSRRRDQARLRRLPGWGLLGALIMLAGVLSGPEPTAVLSALSAGQTCPDS